MLAEPSPFRRAYGTVSKSVIPKLVQKCKNTTVETCSSQEFIIRHNVHSLLQTFQETDFQRIWRHTLQLLPGTPQFSQKVFSDRPKQKKNDKRVLKPNKIT